MEVPRRIQIRSQRLTPNQWTYIEFRPDVLPGLPCAFLGFPCPPWLLLGLLGPPSATLGLPGLPGPPSAILGFFGLPCLGFRVRHIRSRQGG